MQTDSGSADLSPPPVVEQGAAETDDEFPFSLESEGLGSVTVDSSSLDSDVSETAEISPAGVTPQPTTEAVLPPIEPAQSHLTQQLNAMQQAIEQLRQELGGKTASDPSDDAPIFVRADDGSVSVSQTLSTLYVHEQGAVVSCSNKRFIVHKEKQTLLEVPAIKVNQLVIFGRCQVTTQTVDFCLKGGIAICFLSQGGTYYGKLAPPAARQVLLHQQQFRANADPTISLKLAKTFIDGKIHNQRMLLQRRQRNLSDPALQAAVAFLSEMQTKAASAATLDELRGYEGNASARYFSVFGQLLDDNFNFTKRIKHPPTDPVNAMLSFGYTLLFSNIYGLVEVHNLHPYVGLFHALRDGHPALVSDLIEEFRALVVDPLVIYLINRRMMKPADFERGEKLPCRLTDTARKTFVSQFEARMATQVFHPPTGYTVDYRRCIALQITQLVQCLRGERETYVPMKGKA